MNDAVDVHCHYIPAPLLERIRSEGRARAIEVVESGRGTVVSFAGRAATQPLPQGMLDLEDRIAWMDERGIELQMLSCWIDFSAYELDPDAGAWLARSLNDATAEAVCTRSDRFRAMASVPLQAPEAAAHELRRAVTSLGMVGVEIASSVAGAELDEPALDPFWTAAAELGTVVLVHPYRSLAGGRMGRYLLSNAVGNPAEETLAAAYLAFGGVLERHPDLTVCLTHGGGFFPYQVGRQDRAHRAVPKLAAVHASRPPSAFLRRFLYDSITHSPESLRFLVERVGAERVVLGSDYPFPMGDLDPLDTVRAAALGPLEADAVRAGNAVRVFRL
ncbi:MAG: amidohydrolase family protein [Actinomycetota bacterium]